MNILLLDDDSFLRDMYATKFTEGGHTVEAVGDGAVALALFEEKEFDVVLLDMIMPGMSGIEFLEKAKKIDKNGITKFIILSNQSEESDRSKAKELGGDGYIVKAEAIPSEVVTKVESIVKEK